MLDEGLVLRTLAARGIDPDQSQRHAIGAILALLDAKPAGGWLRRRRGPLGVYCHGLPGRGKSMVVDTMFALATCAKRRIHFHEFLREIRQRQMSEPPGSGDPLVLATRRWLTGIELLCFDEFHVHDIADAFLVGWFLDTALALGVRLVLTSNYAPDGLLPNPQYHERFRPTIERIENDFEIVHFTGERDYRCNGERPEAQRFLTPLNRQTAAQLSQIYAQAEDRYQPQPAMVQVAGRPLQARAAGKNMLWANFDDLCVASRSHLDYLELAERWDALIVDQVHVKDLSSPSTLQRFIWLVDIFYDRNHRVLIAADRPLAPAIRELVGAHDLSRTLSRLAQMQARSYDEAGALAPRYAPVAEESA
jgi:cell division protein ZapE